MIDDSTAASAAPFTALADRALDGDSIAAGDLLREGAGSVEALRALYEAGIVSHDNPDELAIGAMKFEVVARLIAAKTGAQRDRRCVAACLVIQALEYHRIEQPLAADDAAGEALSIFRQLVDEGDGQALVMLAHFPEQFAHLRDGQEREKSAALVPDALAQAREDLEQARARADALTEALTAAPLPMWERLALWMQDRGWRLRIAGWAVADLGRAIIDVFRR